MDELIELRFLIPSPAVSVAVTMADVWDFHRNDFVASRVSTVAVSSVAVSVRTTAASFDDINDCWSRRMFVMSAAVMVLINNL